MSGLAITYGNYTHSTGEAGYTISVQSKYGEGGQRLSYIQRWDIQGLLVNPSGTLDALQRKIDELKAAYAVENQNLTVKLPGGGDTSDQLIAANTINGVKVVQPPSFPVAFGPQLVTLRNFTVALEAEFFAPAGSELVRFNRTITIRGGGKRLGMYQPANADPFPTILKRKTPYFVTEQGEAVGYLGYPAFPPPSFPDWVHNDADDEKTTVFSNAPTNKMIRWRYEYVSPTRIGGATWNGVPI